MSKTSNTKTSSKKTASKKSDPVSVVEEEVAQVVEKKRTVKSKSTKAEKVQAAPATPAPATEVKAEGEQTKRTRREVSKETILEDFDGLLKELESELESAKQDPDKKKNAKFVKLLSKRVKQLRSDTQKAVKSRKKASDKPRNTTSGFMKPVQISKEMAQFTGWDPAELKSRVDVTKYICDYIKEKELQNPEDRRIIKPDNKLQSLLKLTGSADEPPLTYYTLQKNIQHHFTSTQA